MIRRILFLALLSGTAIGLGAAGAIADESKDDHVVIIKCAETNEIDATPTVVVNQASEGFESPLSCEVGNTCADCLADLIRKPFPDCEGHDEFTSNVAVVQQSDPNVAASESIEKYVFACGARL